jgi:DNA polymerase I-like protein with 3'-5' exonuclease and polymerase domains
VTHLLEEWDALGGAIQEAAAIGIEFHVVGADVQIAGLNELPGALRERLEHFQHTGLLYAYLGAEDIDIVAQNFLDELGVTPVLVTTVENTSSAIAELSRDLQQGIAPCLGLDIETAPKGWRPPPVILNKDGGLSGRNALRKEDDGNPGLDPAQLYAGGERCFVFRGDALGYLLRSRWLREQHLVAHSAEFELTFLRKHARPADGPIKRYSMECTRQAFGLLYGFPRSLAWAAEVIFGIETPKALQTSCWSATRLSNGQIAYAAIDAVLTHRLWMRLDEQLEIAERRGAYELQARAIPAVADMQLRGLGIDLAEHRRQVDGWSQDLAAARREYHEKTGKTPPSGPTQVREWLADMVEIDTWPRTASGQLSIERKHLKRLIVWDEPTVKPVLEMLAKEKLISTFGPKLAALVNPVTRRLHASYSIAGAKSGRFTASHPNLQQLPTTRAPEFKRCVIPAPGYVLVVCDWSQVEMRAAAWISRDEALTAVYAEGRDLHRETAAIITGVPVEKVTAGQRQAAKPVNFGAIYGIGPHTLAEDAFDNYSIDMTVWEAKRALDRFFATYRTLDRWRREHFERCKRCGFVEVPGSGRIIKGQWQIENNGNLTFPQCCNLPVQGMCADLMLRALRIVFNRLRGLDAWLVATVHDEIVVEAREDVGEEVRAVLEETMTEVFAVTFPGAPIAGLVKAGIGSNWLEAKR